MIHSAPQITEETLILTQKQRSQKRHLPLPVVNSPSQCFNGFGFETTLEIELRETENYLLETLLREHPRKQSLPWERLWLSCEGRNLAVHTKSIRELQLHNCDRIRVTPRLCGGGGDGGSTGAESRDAYLTMYKLPKADKVDGNEEKLAKWTCCQLSGEALTPPCVCDELGTLFNKEAVIKALIEKSMPGSLSHITSIKHVIPLELTPKPSSTMKSTAKDAKNYQMAKGTEIQFHCPITHLELNGMFRFSVHVKTGYVISDRALKEAPKAVTEVLGMESTPEDWMPLNGSPEVVKRLREKLITTRALSKSKKAKKRSRTVPEEGADVKKKPRAVDYAPEKASKQIYASIFSNDDGREGETFLCRSVGARGMNLT